MEREKLIRFVQKAQAGNPDAISALFEGYKNTVYSIALRETKDRALAEDIVQETFLEVILTIDNLKNPEAISLWIKHIAYHQCTRYYKKKETKHEIQAEELEDGLSVFDTLEERNAAFIPDEALDQKEFRETILSMIDELPDVQSSALRMFYYDGLPLKVIAKAQGVSVNTANTRLNRGRKAMKDSVESYEKKHGIRLHTIAFFPLFRWLLADTKKKMPAQATAKVAKNIAAETGIHLAAEAGATTGSASAAAGTTSASSASAASSATGAAAAGAGVKAAAGSIATKVIAGVLATSVAVGSATVYKKAQANAPAEPTTPSASQVIVQENLKEEDIAAYETLDVTAPPSVATLTPTEAAIEAYEELLHNGTTQQGFVINYYAYLDVDQDGVPELIAADQNGQPESWTTCEMYTYENGAMHYCGSTDARYTPFFYVNGSYLLGTNRMGAWYVSPDDTFRTVDHYSTVDPEQIYSEKVYNDGTSERITKEEFDWYNAFEADHEGGIIPGGFVETAEPIILQKNDFRERNVLEKALDLSQVWSVRFEYNGYKIVANYLFESNGSSYCAIGLEYSEIIAFYQGTYVVEDDIIRFTMDTGDGIWEYAYRFNSHTLQLTQVSETSPFAEHSKGTVLQIEDGWVDVEQIEFLKENGLSDNMAP